MVRRTEAVATGSEADGVYFGLMSGTSMDGVDGVAVLFAQGKQPAVLGESHVGFSTGLRDALFALQSPGDNELERAALAANALATRYAVCCHELQSMSGVSANKIRAIGVHGQTVRHRPEKGYTWQINNPSLLAEMTRIDVIADLRAMDRLERSSSISRKVRPPPSGMDQKLTMQSTGWTYFDSLYFCFM